MVTDAVIGFFFNVINSVLGLLPTITVPDWLSSADGPIATVLGYAGSMGAWFPSTLVLTVVTAVLATWAIGFVIKLVRIVASFFTLGGGSAA
jgi:hypothetical protein